jgi:CRISPR system Cascade subunit CasB
MAENPRDLTLIALAAGVLATVRANDPMHPARRVGPRSPKEPDTARLKPLRFRRLMEADGTDERLIAFRRLAAMAEYKLNIQELVGAFLDWGPNRQRDWVLEYWDAARRPADPAQIPSATEIA